MKIARILVVIMLIGTLLSGKIKAQSIASAASTAGDNIALSISSQVLLGMNATSISISMTTIRAGATLSSVSNHDIYLKISSLVPIGTSRRLTVRIIGGSIPAGTKLSLYSDPCTIANSGGALGNVVSTPVTLSNVDQNLITGIGTSYTGSATSDGYRMNFTWSVNTQASNYGQIVSGTYNPVVAFTITAPE